MIIGITGSFGSGKTTVANIFVRYGYKVINADRLYRGLIKKDKSLYKKIKKEFGTTNRKKLKNIVFNDYAKLKKLNKITHPVIIEKIKSLIKKDKKIVIDAPLLIEANALSLIDKLIVVKCNKNKQMERLLKKGRYTKKEINHIIKSQMPLNKKLKYADFIINNNYSLNRTKGQVKKIIKSIK
jgi:dephospho-CoA kinase